MTHYIVLTKQIANSIQTKSSVKTKLPRRDLSLLAERLNASFLEQDNYPIQLTDRILAKLSSTPGNWAFARFIASQLKSDDIVFCPGEEIGIPLAAILSSQKKRPKIIVWFHRITGLKSRLALKLFKIGSVVDLAVVNTNANKKFVQKYLNFESDRCFFWRHTTDCSYFMPKDFSESKSKPIIASVGLEQRDYRLLASATETLDVDVKVAGFSQFQSRVAKSFPKVLPANMTNKQYHLPELVRLYHDARVVVVPLKENIGSAGITALLEAMACKKATVCVKTKGLADYLLDEDAVMTIEPGDVDGLQKAILYLLDNPEEAKSRAERAYQLVWEKNNLDGRVEAMVEFIKTVE